MTSGGTVGAAEATYSCVACGEFDTFPLHFLPDYDRDLVVLGSPKSRNPSRACQIDLGLKQPPASTSPFSKSHVLRSPKTMPPDSPSASSLFLPLGKRPRRDSKSSLTNELSQDALSEALKNIHNAASQSQNLTVFNEYTEPPTAPSRPESKGLSVDLQGGLTGLYNKFRASVGGPKEPQSPSEAQNIDTGTKDKLPSLPPSGRVSRVSSPKISAFDSSTPVEASSQLSKLSSKPTSVSKLSIPSPGVRSPTSAPHPSILADPALTEVTIHATAKKKNHSRTGSSHDGEDSNRAERSFVASVDEKSLRKVLSKSESDTKPSWLDSSLPSPQLTPSGYTGSRMTQPSHDRSRSDHSVASYQNKASFRINTEDDKELENPNTILQDSAIDHMPHQNPLHLLADQDTDRLGQSSLTASFKENEAATSSVPDLRKIPGKVLPRVSQSRLPGFQSSRTSSTDSVRTAALAALAREKSAQLAEVGKDDFQNRYYSRLPNKSRSRLLSREYWMKDENARDCFRCGEPFTTFRRKHHCRTCGQIFDNKCTTLISGTFFDVPNAVRVCRPCEAIITSHEDDSSDYSVDETAVSDVATRPRTPEMLSARYDDDNISIMSQSLEQMAKTPVMNLPVRRAFDKENNSSAVLEFDTNDRILPRPSSSRSLRTSHSIGHGHKRHHSRHQHIRSYKAYHDERAPFQRRTLEDLKDKQNSAFHRDSIIDPELAQYLSDDASSGEDQVSNEPIPEMKLTRSAAGVDRTTIGGLLAAVRKGRSRMGDRSIAGFLNLSHDADDAASIISSRAIDGPRSSRKRTLSVASSVHRLTPKSTKERLHIIVPGEQNGDYSASPAFPPPKGSRMIRSASMHGLGAPSLELNRASIQHVHKLLKQLLKDSDIPRASSWEDALIPILLRATDDVDPDVHTGDDIDIRNYVKLKKIPGGRPADTAYISGLVFTKNVALKSMARSVLHPRILIITFPLEYARYEQHFMSLDPVIRQEKEYLANIVGRIAALKPDILLAQRNISGLALELLDKAKIATVYNVKASIIEAVSRCTQARIHHSMDKLALASEQLGTCDSFEVKTFMFDGRRKTYIYLSGCPPQLGCTIALRGADRVVLSKIKRITDFMIYVVYNLKLETCLMRDEWALIPMNDNIARHAVTSGQLMGSKQTDSSQNEDGNGQPDQILSKSQTHDSSDGVNLEKRSQPAPPTRSDSMEGGEIPDDIPVPTFYEDLADKHQTRILSASPFVKFAQPYLLMRARELERRVAYLKKLRDQDLSDHNQVDEKAKSQKFMLITPEMVHSSLEGTSRKVREIVHAVHDTEYDKALFNYETQKRQWEAYLSGNRNLFDPYAHQNIVVLFSQVSTATNVPCSGPDLLAFSFYNEHELDDEFEADCTLGQYVEDLCYRANDICPSEACGKRMSEHHRQYVHGEAQITVFVQPHPPKMRGLQDVILMWSQCKICGMETTVTPMSISTWKYSFGKYLELSFWSADLHARAGVCPHDLHRDHLRYFGYKDFALRVHYDPIDLLEIVVPRMQITWKVDNDLRFRNEVFTRLEHRITKFMVSVKLRLKSMNVEAIAPEVADTCRAEIENLTKKANEDHASLIKQLQERYTNSHHWEIIPLNRAMRALQDKVADWDLAFTDFERNFFPSEKDIRRLATLQLKKIFLDSDVSVTSLVSDEDAATTSGGEEADEKAGSSVDSSLTRKLSPEKTQNVLQSVLEEQSSSEDQQKDTPAQDIEKPSRAEVSSPKPTQRKVDDLDHLDLALSSSSPQTGAVPEFEVTVPSGGEMALPSKGEASTNSQPTSSEPKKTDATGSQDFSADEKSTPQTQLASPSKIQIPESAHRTLKKEKLAKPSSHVLKRAHSQPSGTLPLRKDSNQSKTTTLPSLNALSGLALGSPTNEKSVSGSASPKLTGTQDTGEKKLSDRFGFSQLKNHKFVKGQSLIPRAISNRKESRVSTLAKHFEQLSREFERERMREKKLRAARSRQARIYPLAASKPTVEVYKDVNEAVDESGSSDDIFQIEQRQAGADESTATAEGMAKTEPAHANQDGHHAIDTPGELTENEAEVQPSSHAPSETEEQSEIDEPSEEIHLPDSPEDLLRLTQEDVDLKDLPKHERTSLMKMLTNFWAERSSSGWSSLEYPFGASDHIFADCDIIVREDELSSIVAFALDSSDYKAMLHDIQHREPNIQNGANTDIQADVMHSLLRKTGSHFRYQFQEGGAKMLCKIFFAEQFDAMRRKCGVADRFVESLSRCMKFDSKGGKSKSLFLKTLDDRFVLKSLSPVETQSFLKFAPNYFQIMSEAFFHELPSVIAKMLGFYQIIIKNPMTGVEHNWYLLVMENLFYDRVPTRIFDLKGSMRNRKINATGERNEVLLDENMVEFIYESPLFAREHAKKLLRSSVHNDTLFLARQNVMDYSLMIAIEENRRELVVGIIDCIRTYTWDKKLESWIKDRGFAGGGKNKPTVTSPKEYKRRFREAMSRYVLEAPSCWHQFRPVSSENMMLKIDGDGEKGENEVHMVV